jgi:glycosyltransferase involved in cell wall biosynthesis
MRIALIAPPWVPIPPPAYGGTEGVIDRLARGILATGHQVVLFATGDTSCPVPTAWYYEQGQMDRIGSGLVEMRQLIDAYDTVSTCDVVHDHTMLGPLYASGFDGPPVVTTAHGEFTDETIPIYQQFGDRISIIAISRDQAQHATGIPIAKVIHHGLDLEGFPVGDGRGGYVVYLGRMTAEKGAREAALVSHRTGVPLKIAAKCREPSEQEYFDEHVRPLVGGPVEYLGEIDTSDKCELLGGALALLNPIQWAEPFGLVMVEALACGTPVLSFRAGAAPEIIRHGCTGFLCNDVTDMAAKVERLGEIDRANCRSDVEVRFSASRMVAEHLDLYRDVLGDSTAAPAVTTAP